MEKRPSKGTTMIRTRSRRLLAGLAAVSVLALAACSSQGGAQNQNQAAGDQGKRLTIRMITHGAASDAFWTQIQTGAKEAAAKDNVEFEYAGSGQIPEQSTFIQNAIDSKVDGIIVTLPNAAALGPVVQKAVAAGIPVVTINAGDRDWQKSGALAFFGEPETLAGEFAGTELNKLGAKHALCILHAQGQIQLEDRCNGTRSKFSGQTEDLFADGSDIPTYVSTVSSKLRQDPSIDAVITLDSSFAVAVQKQLEQDGSTAKIVTYAFNNDLIPLLQNDKVAFTIDQQPYLQGYLAVDSLWLYKRNKSVIGANLSVPTGPVVVNQSNIADLIPSIKEGLR
jgi:simple sugar transport system substrate-binding protein